MSENKRILKIVTDFQELLIAGATGTTIPPAKYQELRNNILSEPFIRDWVPEFVITSRDLSRFWNFISSKSSTYKGRRIFIWGQMDPLIKYLENENFDPINLKMFELIKGLNVPIIAEHWKKTSERLKNDPEGAITSAKSMVETVCKHILDVHKETYTEYDDIKSLYKNTSKVLKIDTNPKINQTLLKIFSGCTSTITGIAELRNQVGDAHGKGISYSKINNIFAELAVNLSGSMTIFLIKTHLDNKNKLN
ncbi:MAG: abortive infection family protein [Candidatus Magasanikbacteria bacterium]|nr:abortive infection family protein [Candidatus Magasanikbacteria bacterium]